MDVVMFIDEERFRRESRMLSGLARELADRGWRVSRILPAPIFGLLDDTPGHVAVAGVEDHPYPPRVMPWQRRMQIRRWPERLLDADVVMGIGTSTWRWADDFARIADAVALLDVWCADQVTRAHKPRRDSRVCGYVAATAPLAAALAREVGGELVSHVPWGISSQAAARREAPADGEQISLAMIDAGLDIESYQAVLGAVRRLISEGKPLQLVVELRGPQGHSMWQYAQQLELLDHIACVADAADCRPLLVECDVLLLPDRFGQMRSIILDAMVHGVPIVAADDPMLDFLEGDKTCLVVDRDEPDAWHAKIRKIIQDKDLYRSIASAARSYVRTSATPSRHLDTLIETLETAVSGSALAFGSQLGGE